jgi:hypothetical protein
MAHEDLKRKHRVAGSSDRTFGLVIGAACLVVALGPLRHGQSPRWWALIASGALALIALLRPALLATANRLWTQLGVLIGKVVSPIALGFLFYAVFTPVALLLRITGQDPLRLKLDRGADSYWIARDPPGPAPDSMRNQF